MGKRLAVVACAFGVAGSVLVSIPRAVHAADATLDSPARDWTDGRDFSLTESPRDGSTRFRFGLDYDDLFAGLDRLDTPAVGSSEDMVPSGGNAAVGGAR
jgi:hypothetical protein